MSYRAPVVLVTTNSFRVLSYGNGAALEIIRLGSAGHTTFLQGEESAELADKLNTGDSERDLHDLISEYYYVGV